MMRFGLLLTFLLSVEQISVAQQTVQLPVVGVTSVNTTVTVPDGGRAFMGGVSSAQSGRSQYGRLRSGPSTGITRQATSITTSVYIHDLHAMDEELLNSIPSPSELSRRGKGLISAKPDRVLKAEPTISPDEKATKFEHLARKADEAGKSGVAKLHWQMAAKYGSKTAEQRLDELTRASSTKSTRPSAP